MNCTESFNDFRYDDLFDYGYCGGVIGHRYSINVPDYFMQRKEKT